MSRRYDRATKRWAESTKDPQKRWCTEHNQPYSINGCRACPAEPEPELIVVEHPHLEEEPYEEKTFTKFGWMDRVDEAGEKDVKKTFYEGKWADE